MNLPLYNKKIGIWGFGIVGKSYLSYLQRYTKTIQICDVHPTKTQFTYVEQDNTQAFAQFVKNNDYIFVSPGIANHHLIPPHKKITELDIWQKEFQGSTIAITGSAGKTTITSHVSKLLDIPAGGNIGKPMLDLLTIQKQPKTVALELSSFQLQHTKNFAPDLAIWSNFYPNHLDHHKDEAAYFAAKANIVLAQKKQQHAILPGAIAHRFHHLPQQVTWIYQNKPTTLPKTIAPHHTYIYCENQTVYKTQPKKNPVMLYTLTSKKISTYLENILILIATLYIQNKPLDVIETLTTTTLKHRLEPIGTYFGKTFFNDSKATIWQATKEAVLQMPSDEKTILLVGGLSKGANRKPLFAALPSNTIVHTFGTEAQQLKQYAQEYNIQVEAFSSLQSAVQACFSLKGSYNILLSPGGSSFDEFKNYKERGDFYKKLVQSYNPVVEQSKDNPQTLQSYV